MEEEGSLSDSPKSQQSCSQETRRSECQKRETRITKENLYMALALWMEKFRSTEPDGLAPNTKKVGVVFVLPTDRVLAADCSREGVHGVARVIVNHAGKLRGCKVFVSRKPCSLCAKLLVQSRVSRVFYLPIEPESAETEKKVKRVDNLFKASPVGESVFVPCIEEKVLNNEDKKLPEEVTPDDIGVCRDELFKELWSDKWLQRIYSDDAMKSQVESDFRSLMKWIAGVKAPIDKGVEFRKVRANKDLQVTSDSNAEKYGDEEMAKNMMIFAKMLARQTDDPKTGVGAVIVKGSAVPEIVALGWNGFPSKALYGEFPRASDDEAARETKFPFVIHAEQNALMVRNTKDLSDGVLFVTKTPCDQCAPLLKLSGVNTVVVGEAIGRSQGGELTYNLIKEYIKKEIFSCYEMTTLKRPAKRQSSDPEIRKKVCKSMKTEEF